MNIGDWVRRANTKAHLVESVVADDAFTRCGRRMRNEKLPPLQVDDTAERCWFCSGRPRG